MSYQHGYQQQPQQPQQQPYGGYPGGGGYPDSSDTTNPALAIIAAVLALAATASLVVVNLNELGELSDVGAGFGDLPSEYQTVVILRFAAAAVLLAGAIIIFARKLAGAFVTVLGGLAGLAAVLLYPVLLSDVGPSDMDFGSYLQQVFEFGSTPATFSAIALIASLLALILAILPPTLNYLKGSRSSDGYGGYPQQPQQGW